MYVAGYDTSVSGHDFVETMTERFASCGELIHIYIPGYARGRNLNRFVLIYLRGEDAEEKALALSGSYSSKGHKLIVEPYPFDAKHHDSELAPMRDADNKQRHVYAYVHVEGIDTIEKLMQLCGCDVKGLEDIKLSRVDPPERVDDSSCDMPPLSTWGCSSSRTAPEDLNLPKPPPEGEDPPYPWKCSVNSETGYLCFWNPNTGVRIEEPPSASPIRYAHEDPHLPKPWKRLADSYGYSYWWNTETGVTQYEKPGSNLVDRLF
ncbi:unnamed protein product [Microthlaspi erraticum]|uniref:WW domain-containing protein n=1 Tax=Microthlaspi erraticum TaxID=1685480 RepID=A0A6D2INW0_9BRAS|nr:unnamed protein product [Microthlaspi erraticum]